MSRLLAFLFCLIAVPAAMLYGEGKAVSRSYETGLTDQNKKDITLIITSLARKGKLGLLSCRSQLNNAGDRIQPVHPLRFLEFAFSNEELKAGMHAIRAKHFEWHSFFDEGIKMSLDEEAKKNNITDIHMQSFCKNIGLSPSLLCPLIVQRKWNDLINALLANLPRDEKAKKYGM